MNNEIDKKDCVVSISEIVSLEAKCEFDELDEYDKILYNYNIKVTGITKEQLKNGAQINVNIRSFITPFTLKTTESFYLVLQ